MLGPAVSVFIPVLKEVVRRITFVEWRQIEEELGPLLERNGLASLSIESVGERVAIRLSSSVAWVWLPLYVLVHPAELDLGVRIRLRVDLLGAEIERAEGLWGWLVSWASRWWVRHRYGELMGLVTQKLQARGIRVEASSLWIDLTELPAFQEARRRLSQIPFMVEPDFSKVVRCERLVVKPTGLQPVIVPAGLAKQIVGVADAIFPRASG